jgi:hypothetical protein
MKRLLGFLQYRKGRSIFAALLSIVVVFYYYREPTAIVPYTAATSTLVKEKTTPETQATPATPLPLPKWIEAYVESQKNMTTTQPYVRYRCQGWCGGTGDRLNGIIQAFHMAMCTNRAFYIDWQLPLPLDGYLEPHLIQWNQVPQAEADLHINSINDNVNQYVRNPYLLPTNASVDIQANLFLREDLLRDQACVKDYLIKHGVHDTSQQLDMYRHAYSALFRPSRQLKEGVQQVQKSMSLGQTYIAIHIRTGRGKAFVDLLTEANDESTWPRYLECAHLFRDALHQPQAQLFLAADTESAKENLQAMDSSIRTRDTEIFHIDITQSSELANEQQAYLDVFIDIQLLVDATCLVKSPSMFSRLGDWLNPQQPRCALLWNECTQENVQRVVAGAVNGSSP